MGVPETQSTRPQLNVTEVAAHLLKLSTCQAVLGIALLERNHSLSQAVQQVSGKCHLHQTPCPLTYQRNMLKRYSFSEVRFCGYEEKHDIAYGVNEVVRLNGPITVSTICDNYSPSL